MNYRDEYRLWKERFKMKLKQYLNEVYMPKALQKDMDAKKGKPAKYSIKVDGFEEETAKTIKRANTLRAEWIRFYMRNNKVSKQEAEKAVVIEDLNEAEYETGYGYIDKFKPEALIYVHHQQEKVKFIGKNWVGNKYKKGWVGYFLEPSKEAINTIHGKLFNVQIKFTNKKEMDDFLKKVKQ